MTIAAVILAIDPGARITADPNDSLYHPLICIENVALGRRTWASTLTTATSSALKLYFGHTWKDDLLRE